MKTHHPKPRPLFSCGFFRHCTQTVLSPTAPHPPSLPLTSSAPPPPQPPSPPPPHPPPLPLPSPTLPSNPRPESSSSSSSTSQSFTQWKFPLPTSPLHPQRHMSEPYSQPDPKPELCSSGDPLQISPPIPFTNIHEVFHVAELQLMGAVSDYDQLSALHLLERSLVPNPPTDPVCRPNLMLGVVSNLRSKAGAKPATKILLALCLAECNRLVAVEAGAVGAVVETAMELEAASAERALAALELMCTVLEGAAAVRAHALAVPVMVAMMGKMGGRGREYAISVLAVTYGGGGGENGETAVTAPPEEVARAVALALQGESTQRGRRKGAHLLKVLEEYGRVDLTQYASVI